MKQKGFLWKKDVLKAPGHFKENRETMNLLFEECSCQWGLDVSPSFALNF